MEASIKATQTRFLPAAALAAYVPFGLYSVLAVLFAGVVPAAGPHPPLALLLALNLTAVAFHLALFPVIARLPAPDWGKAAGYGYLVIDIASSIMSVNGVLSTTAMPLRLGGHIAAATWVAAAAWQARGLTRVVGLGLAVALAAYSFAAPWVSFAAFMPAVLLMIAWLFLTVRRLGALSR